MKRVLLATIWIAGCVAVLYVGLRIAFTTSPWPAVLIIRYAFDRGAALASNKLLAHVPHDVAGRFDLTYDAPEGDPTFDIFYPAAVQQSTAALPAIVWVHGGGWISGSKEDVDNYAKILAGHGFTVVSLDYTIAPEAHYPTPVVQVNAALGYLSAHAGTLHIDRAHMILAGDSGGAQIVAQVANVISDPSYARRLAIVPSIPRSHLAAMLLFCGAYDTHHVNLDGRFGAFLIPVLWAYSGTKDFAHDRAFETASVIDYVTRAFPPSFISAGNGDPLEPQSREFASTLERKGAAVTTLFFPPSQSPALPHEYQFDLDTPAGRSALRAAIAFAKEHA